MSSNQNHKEHAGVRRFFLAYGSVNLILLSLSIICLAVLVILIIFVPEHRTELAGIEHYGNYIGTNNDKEVREFINSFFPEKLHDSFSDIEYVYRATDFGSYACEAYLEFKIEDEQAFAEFVSSLIQDRKWDAFVYDSNFVESCLTDTLFLRADHPNPEKHEFDSTVSITDARIGRILYSVKDRKVVFSAMLVSNDSVVETDYFNLFFERFNIDPIDYTDKVSFSE